MPRKPNPDGRKIGNVAAEAMKDALQQISQGLSIRHVSKETGIPFSTLYRYNTKRKAGGSIENIRLEPNYAVNRIFNSKQEEALKDYFTQCALMFYGLTTTDCRKVAYQMAVINQMKIPASWTKDQLAGIDWLKGFRKRHPELSLRRPEGCSIGRATAFNMHTVSNFYDNLHTVYSRFPCFADGSRVFNLDETATTTVQKPPRVICPKGVNVNKVTTGEMGILLTTCLIICAAGYALPPVVILPRKKFKDHMIIGAPPGTLGLATKKGWMTTETFVETMAHFIKHTYSSMENPSLLVMDNHKAHLSIDALDLAKANGVTVLTFHPHTTAKMQPLDVGVNAPFKVYYNAAVDWMMRNPGKGITIYDLPQQIGNAFYKAMTPSNITSAFQKTGIFPFDKHKFTEDDFLPSSVTNRPNPESTNDETRDIDSDRESPSLLQNTPNLSYLEELQYNEEEHSPSELRLEPHHPEVQSNSHNQQESHINQNKNENPLVHKSPQEPQPGCSKDKSTLYASFIKPNQFRSPIKAQPRKNTRKRKLGRSIIATDTPEKEAIRAQNEESQKNKKPKQKLKKTVDKKVLQSLDDTDDAAERGNISKHGKGSNCSKKNKKPKQKLKKTVVRKVLLSEDDTDDDVEKENIPIRDVGSNWSKSIKKPKQKPKKTVVRRVLQSESDTEDDIGNENISIHDEDSDWCEEDETEIAPLTDEQLLNGILPRCPEEGDYVLVRFDTKRRCVYYVGKILQNRNENLEYYVSFLRGNRKHQFNMPNVPDLAYVKEHDIKLILPEPNVGGSTLRQQSYYYHRLNSTSTI